jgi:hypothetical protein
LLLEEIKKLFPAGHDELKAVWRTQKYICAFLRHGFYGNAVATSAIYPNAYDVPKDREAFAVGSSWPYGSSNRIMFDASRNVRTANETRVASISAFLGIKY